ncbi:MAG: sugar ABC transporter permease [Firmicutes bacterium]|jgi:ABC-type sugar transport system permease subunit|nr:sugar ABC transporter permease [Bacillota bacterium]MDH7496169.1 sugar ABC transporter permease [Bacillota bacterium]
MKHTVTTPGGSVQTTVAHDVAKPKRRARALVYRVGELLESYSMIAPAYMVFLVFIFIPVAWSFYLSLFNYSILSLRQPQFTGLANFIKMFKDSVFRVAIWNTLRYSLGTVPARLVLGLALALLLDQKHLSGKNLLRTVYFLPVVTSMVAASIVWTLVFNASEAGLANQMLKALGFPPKGWLADSRLAMLSVCIMSVWKELGYVMTIFLAGLQGIPPELHEAAAIDGATGWQRIRFITIPLLKPTTFFILVTEVIGSFQVFTQTYVMTGGGPGYSTTTLINLLYTKGFFEFDMGYASGLAVTLFLGLLLLSWVMRRAFRAEEIVY